MKIQNNPLQALQQDELNKKQKTNAAEGFDALLTEQLQFAGTKSTGPMPNMTSAEQANAALAMQVKSAQAQSVAAPVATPTAEVLATVSGLLDKLESYTSNISGKKIDLRQAYNTLESMTDELKSIKTAMPNLDQQDSELAALVNELDVLATTETFKFNRGDYL